MRGLFAVTLVMLGCGARSGLETPATREAMDGGVREVDARGFDAGPRDAGPERPDVPIPIDARLADVLPDAASCRPARLALGEDPPAVMLVVDRSGSMNETLRPRTFHYPEPGSRWDVLFENLVGPPRGLVGNRERTVRFGAATFASSGRRCPDLRSVLPELNNHGAIFDVLGAARVEGGTPTGAAIAAVVELLAGEPDGPGGRPVLVLATDGEPNRCGGPEDDTIAELRAAFARGHRTLVVSVASDVGDAFIRAAADAGAGRPEGSGTTFFRGDDYTTLGTALDGAVFSAILCRAELPAHALGLPCEALPLTLDGEALVCDDWDGFRLAGASTIELLGAACDRARMPFPPARLTLGSLCD